ncbi:hypothetical protein LCGC14_1090130 [marine sediment metagenome]|uniref:Uncharacterized protein n=1 Tax=marine sediment metagenome TaxID=412755 RepID=A0A0F9PVQ6_9ZZZZ
MTAITADNLSHFKTKIIPVDGMTVDLPVAASTVIYKDSFVGFNAAGYLVSYIPWAQATTPTGSPFVGIALQHITSQTSAGDALCKVQISGYFEYALTAAAQLDIGKPVFALDNATLTKLHVPAAVATGGGHEFVGTVVGIPSSANVLVDMGTHSSRQAYAAGLITVTRRLDVADVVNVEVYLLHETQNHNGAYLVSANAFVTEAFVTTSASAVVTLAHTLGTDTTLGCTITCITSAPVADLIAGIGGVMISGAAASNDNLILVPADKGVVAKVTTVATGGTITGAIDITATFAIR